MIREYKSVDGKISITYLKESIVGSIIKDTFSFLVSFAMVFISVNYFNNSFLFNIMAFVIWLTMCIKLWMKSNITKEEIIKLIEEN